jgi:hypothetical protein
MEGSASISTDVLARYAADAASDVTGVRGFSESHLPGRRGVRVTREDGRVGFELRLRLAAGASVPVVGGEVVQGVGVFIRP